MELEKLTALQLGEKIKQRQVSVLKLIFYRCTI